MNVTFYECALWMWSFGVRLCNMRGGLICITFCLYIYLSLDQKSKWDCDCNNIWSLYLKVGSVPTSSCILLMNHRLFMKDCACFTLSVYCFMGESYITWWRISSRPIGVWDGGFEGLSDSSKASCDQFYCHSALLCKVANH